MKVLIKLFKEADERAAEREERTLEREERAAEREAKMREKEMEMEARYREREDRREECFMAVFSSIMNRLNPSNVIPPMHTTGPPIPQAYQTPYRSYSHPPFSQHPPDSHSPSP